MSFGTALRAFSAALFDSGKAEKIRQVLDGGTATAIEAMPSTATRGDNVSPEITADKEPAAEKAPARSDAITLLAALQREARLVDLIQENVSEFSDAQVGAAARPCLQQSAAALKRFFDLKAVCEDADGSTVEVGSDASPAKYQWIGEGAGTSGSLIHHGWQASRVELPKFSGDSADAMVVAPAQIQR